MDIFARLVDLMADATTDVSATAVAEMNVPRNAILFATFDVFVGHKLSVA